MKRLILSIALLLIAANSFSLELSSSFGWDNSSFDQSRTSTFGASSGRFSPKGQLVWNVGMHETLNENAWVQIEVARSPITKDKVKALFGLDYTMVSVSAGPILSPFITEEKILGAGLASDLNFRFPGIAFIQVANETSLGAGLTLKGDYFQSNSRLELGFGLPNVILSGRIDLDEIIIKKGSDLITNDRKTHYQLISSFFKKNIPYTLQVRLGYRHLIRAISIAGVEAKDTLHCVSIGLGGNIDIHPRISVFADGEAFLSPWTSGSMRKPANSTFLYSASGGIRLKLTNRFQEKI